MATAAAGHSLPAALGWGIPIVNIPVVQGFTVGQCPEQLEALMRAYSRNGDEGYADAEDPVAQGLTDGQCPEQLVYSSDGNGRADAEEPGSPHSITTIMTGDDGH